MAMPAKQKVTPANKFTVHFSMLSLTYKEVDIKIFSY